MPKQLEPGVYINPSASYAKVVFNGDQGGYMYHRFHDTITPIVTTHMINPKHKVASITVGEVNGAKSRLIQLTVLDDLVSSYIKASESVRDIRSNDTFDHFNALLDVKRIRTKIRRELIDLCNKREMGE